MVISTVKMRFFFIEAFHYLAALCHLGLWVAPHREMHMPVLELSADHDVWLTKMFDYLRGEAYSREGKDYVAIARRFLIHIQKGLTVHNVRPAHVDKYLRSMKRLRRSPQRTYLSEGQRHYCRAALHMLLRFVRGEWPPAVLPRTEREMFHRKLLEGYDAWMLDLRGLCAVTRQPMCQRVAVSPMAWRARQRGKALHDDDCRR
jgi:hypothetical protein